MIIKQSIQEDGNILPEAYNLLDSLPKNVLHHLDYEEFHPADIYDISLERIIMAFLNLKKNLNELEDFENDVNEFQIYSMLETQKELLHAIQAHVDDCFLILKLISPVHDMKCLEKELRKDCKTSATKWMETLEKEVYDDFKNNIGDYRTSGRIVNKIKHNHARLRLLSIEKQKKSFGYYVEGKIIVGKDIKICPDINIHPESTAFSFSRDMAWNFYTIYVISHYLSKSISKSLQKQHGIDVKIKNRNNHYFNQLKDISTYIEKNNFNYFPDEINKPIPKISVNYSSNENVELILKLDNNFPAKELSGTYKTFFYAKSYKHVSYIIQPYVKYIQKRYPIKDFKNLTDREIV